MAEQTKVLPTDVRESARSDEAVERLAFWLFKRGRALSLRQLLEAWTWLPASARRQWIDEAREALLYIADVP